jgi:hypothetical protein
MRPALQALAAQQRIIDGLTQVNQAQANRLKQHELVFAAQREQIASLGRGLRAIAVAAGIEGHVRTAMLKRADEQNPTQPIPEPPAQPAPFSTEETEAPEAMADALTPGLVPGSTKDVAADAVTTNYTPGMDIPGPPVKNLVDVTAPVDGTQGPRPLNEVRTETDVRVGNPMNPQTGFPLRGDFATPQRLGSARNPVREDSGRTMASLRLARLRINAGLAEGEDFAEATRIEKSAFATDAIEHEIRTLESVRTASAKRERPSNLVPRAAAGVQRTVPSLASTASSHAAGDSMVEDADLFD